MGSRTRAPPDARGGRILLGPHDLGEELGIERPLLGAHRSASRQEGASCAAHVGGMLQRRGDGSLERDGLPLETSDRDGESAIGTRSEQDRGIVGHVLGASRPVRGDDDGGG